LCLFGSSGVFGSCGVYNASDGSVYNLDPLTTELDYSGAEQGLPYTYYWNFCKTVRESACFPTPLAAQISDTGTCISLGYGTAIISDHPSGPKAGVSITYVNKQDSQCLGGLERISRIIVSCSTTETRLIQISEPGRCIYLIEMESKFACPGGSPPPPPPQEGCGNYTSTDGTRYSLGPLTHAVEYSGREVGTDYIYYWNFCRNISPTGCYPPPPVTQVSLGGTCTPLGYGLPKLSDHPDGPKSGVTFTYTNTQSHLCAGSIPRVTIIEVGCANTDTRYLNISEPGVCKYLIVMESLHACPAPRF